jgi:hypothetical protein
MGLIKKRMKHTEIQRRIEQRVEEAVDEIADEIEIDVPFYPEVYWLPPHSKRNLNSFGISLKEISLGGENTSFYLHKRKAIVVRENHEQDISEEAAHFLHLTYSGINLNNIQRQDRLSLLTLLELIGYFGSKIVNPIRTNCFSDYQDVVLMNKEKLEEYLKKNFHVNEVESSFIFWIHHQGYGLGERMFQAYKRGGLSRKQVKALFAENFKEEGKAIKTFFDLRKRFWPIQR